MKKKRLAFVDYWSHQSTRSGDFLREIFLEKFEITDFWWKEKKKIPLDELNNFDYIFFFHVMFPHQILRRLKNKKLMWAPMYDALNFRNSFFRSIFWKQISNLGIKVLKFSDKISDNINNEKIDSLKLNYYLEPKIISSLKNQSKLNIFFWDRGRIKLEEWLNLFNKNDINEILYYPKPDPDRKIDKVNHLNISKKYNLKIMEENFMPKDEFISIMEKYNVFIAPRKKEGIGISIVEAISRGIYIVGYDDSTMNEYILNNKIGFIFDEQTKDKINLNDVVKNYDLRNENAKINHDKWQEDKKKIIPLLERDTHNVKQAHFFLLFLLDDIKFFLKKLFKFNFNY